MSERETYLGQCHCGAVRYEVKTDLMALGDCNCSRCARLGWVMQTVPEADFQLVSGEDKLRTYHFNTHSIDHLFCTECGIESFARGKDGEGKRLVTINVNCLVDAPAIDRSLIKHWDGRSW
ncbi:GFA family protein [Devosia sp. ZB163]|uniref:GFA family protein n=1 Tax=Devosia sp. ZB163 TaxID=3025938 RepID=UPI00235E46F3|nr:GFA family protein [Devosia sp. ZB163]MDC9822883.1 GFA family protein [Devosia sp. ZB163]